MESKKTIKGFGGTRVTNVQRGTLLWRWQDDNGQVHKFTIPNSYYVPEGKVRLLSPQHWAKSMKDNKPSEGTGSTTTLKSVTLWWKQRQYSLNVPLSKGTNVAIFNSAPGYTKYTAYCQDTQHENENDDANPIVASSASIEDKDISVKAQSPDDSLAYPFKLNIDPLNGRTEIVEPQLTDMIMTKSEAQLLQYHRNFGHIPFTKLQIMAEQGILPRNLAKCNIPVCSACMGGMITRKNWRNNPRKQYKVANVTKPGERVSVDMLVSPTPGLIAQMSSFLTKKRYWYATVYLDNYSWLGYVYL